MNQTLYHRIKGYLVATVLCLGGLLLPCACGGLEGAELPEDLAEQAPAAMEAWEGGLTETEPPCPHAHPHLSAGTACGSSDTPDADAAAHASSGAQAGSGDAPGPHAATHHSSQYSLSHYHLQVSASASPPATIGLITDRFPATPRNIPTHVKPKVTYEQLKLVLDNAETPKRPYIPGKYECVQFARDLRKELQANKLFTINTWRLSFGCYYTPLHALFLEKEPFAHEVNIVEIDYPYSEHLHKYCVVEPRFGHRVACWISYDSKPTLPLPHHLLQRLYSRYDEAISTEKGLTWAECREQGWSPLWNIY